MRLLLDTNIVIPMEPATPADLEKNTRPALELSRLASLGAHQLFVHPEIRSDIARDRDPERRRLREFLVDRYPTLPDAPTRNRVEGLLGLSTVSPNDAVDNALLAAVEADAVDYLITEDAGIHRKARRLQLTDRVLLVTSALDLFRDLLGFRPPPPPFVRSVKAHAVDPRDPIFDSFRQDYAGFDDWLAKARRDHRDAWTIDQPSGECAAVVIVKKEDGREIGLTAQRVLKLCSFKVAPSANGTKFGELLLKTVFEYAFGNAYDAIYVTVLPKHAALVVLFRQFGFEPLESPTPLGEEVLVKSLKPDFDVTGPLDFHVKFGPGQVRSYTAQPGYVVPIQPGFHDALFPEARPQPLLVGIDAPKPYGSAMRKAYLCNAQVRRIAPGDNLFFYRSQDLRTLACTGVVEKTLVSSEPAVVARFVGVRTVYTYGEIQALTTKRKVLAIIFRHDKTLAAPIRFDDMLANQVLKGPPQSILRVSEGGLRWLSDRLRNGK